MTRLGVLVGVLAVLAAGQASAVIYTGSLTVTAGTLTGTDGWAGGPTSITYTVVDDQATPGLWHYVYTLAVPGTIDGAIQEILISLDPMMTLDDLRSIVLTSGSVNSVGLFLNQGDKSAMPQSMYAVDFTFEDNIRTVTIAFDSLFEPVWGNVFIRGEGDNAAWNAGFTADSVDSLAPPSEFQEGFILRPGVIPEPMTMLTLGLAGAAAGRALRQRLRGA